MSKYLKKFSTVSEYNTYINGSPDLPNVSYITATGDSEVNGVSNEAVGQLPYDGATAFNWKSYVKSVDIQSGYTSIGRIAFKGFSLLTSITISDSVTSIGKQAFQNCSGLPSITIPNSVTEIGLEAFRDCSSLASVTILATTPPTLGTNVFDNNASGRKFYVPAESVETYKTASGWSDYASDIEAIPTA